MGKFEIGEVKEEGWMEEMYELMEISNRPKCGGLH